MVDLVTSDRPNPDSGIRILSRASWVAAGLLLVTAAFAPVNPILTLLLVGAILWARHFATRFLTRQGELEALVTKTTERTFDEIPHPKNPDGSLKVDPGKPTWEPEGVMYEKIPDFEKIRIGEKITIAPWYRSKVERPERYLAQEKWLAGACPDRHRVLRTWWLRAYLLPTLERRFPDYEFKAVEVWDPVTPGISDKSRRPGADSSLPDRWDCHARKRGGTDSPWAPANLDWCQEVALDYQYYLFTGLRLAVKPSRWKRRIDRRPSHRAIGFLHNALLDIYGGNRPFSPELPEELKIILPNFKEVYLGHGFEWDVRHLQKLHETFGTDLATITGGKPTDGDPRIYATGQEEIAPVFVDERTLNYHAGILGSPGSGKTRFLENILVQAVQNGRPVVMIDPKLDRGLFNRIWEVARAVGREHQLHLFHLNAPRCREVSTYNPLYVYTDPAELAARVAAVVERTRDPFWFRVGISTAKAVTMLSHYTMHFLRMVGGEYRDGRWQLAARYSMTPPPYLLALQYLWDNPKSDAKTARLVVTKFLQDRNDPNWIPADQTQANLLEMCKQPFFTPYAWNPSLKPVNVFGIGRPETLVAWALRILYFHLFIEERGAEAKRTNRPDLLSTEEVVGSGDESWWSMYLRAKEHPFKALIEPGYVVPKFQTRAVEVLREFIPPEAIEQFGRTDCENWEKYVHDALRMMHAKASEERKEYTKHMSTLAASLANFEGERERLMTSQDPDIVIGESVMNGGIVYYATNYMKDQQASEGAARTFVVDTLAHLGEVYGSSAKGRFDFYLACDEIGTFLTTDFTPIMSQGRSAGVHTILLGQNGVDTQVAMGGDKAKADQIMGVTVTKVQLNSGNLQDAREFSEALGRRTIKVRGGFSLSTDKAYGNTGVSTIGDYRQSMSENWQDKEVERLPPSALLALPTGQAFVRSKFGLHLVIQGQLRPPKVNVMQEYGLLKYIDPSEPEPPIAIRHMAEIDLANARIEQDGIFPGTSGSQWTPTDVPSRHMPKDRGADCLRIERTTGDEDSRGSSPERTSHAEVASTPDADSRHSVVSGLPDPALESDPHKGDEAPGDDFVVR